MKASLFIALLLIFAPVQKSNLRLEIGAKLKRNDVPKRTSEYTMTHSAQMRPFIRKIVDGVEYIVAYDSKSREIKYIHTKDKKFRTTSGLRVGANMNAPARQRIVYPCWEIRVPMTEDGWYPVLGHDSRCATSSGLPRLDVSPEDSVEVIGFSKGGN